ncbi:MAG: ACT domain-containing protein [bacterium]|jgi:ACT domain-containing protein
MKAVITVTGKDKVGIIARICTALAANNVNILDINQTILQDYFTMIMLVDLSGSTRPFDALKEFMVAQGKEIGVVVTMQHEDIFNAMHEI